MQVIPTQSLLPPSPISPWSLFRHLRVWCKRIMRKYLGGYDGKASLNHIEMLEIIELEWMLTYHSIDLMLLSPFSQVNYVFTPFSSKVSNTSIGFSLQKVPGLPGTGNFTSMALWRKKNNFWFKHLKRVKGKRK